MFFDTWFRSLRSRRTSTPSARCRTQRGPKRPFRPQIEALEDRLTPSLGFLIPVNASGRDQGDISVARAINGSSVVVWDQQQVGSANHDIIAQLLDAAGNKVGSTITVANTMDDEWQPDVAMDGVGNFVVAWTAKHGSIENVQYSTFSITGALITSGNVTGFDLTRETNPRVAMNAAGGWVIAFETSAYKGSDIFAQRYTLGGTQIGSDIVVAAGVLADEIQPKVDCNDNGWFSVAYVNRTTHNLILRRYRPDGQLSGAYRIAQSLGLRRDTYDVAMDNAGNSTVVFRFFVNNQAIIFSRQVTAGGLVGSTRIVANGPSSSPSSVAVPQIAMDRKTGKYVVAYHDPGGEVVAEFSRYGKLLGRNTPTGLPADKLISGAVSFDGAGRYLVGYGYEYSGTDHDVYGALGQL